MTQPEITQRMDRIADRWKAVLERAEAVTQPIGVTLWYSEGGSVRHSRLTRNDRAEGDPVQESIHGILDALGSAYRNHLLQIAAEFEVEIDRLRSDLNHR